MKKVLCFILVAAAVFMTACGGKEASDKKTEAVEKETVGGSITIYSLKDDTLCPILTDNDANRQMLCIVYESLVRLKSNLEAEGVLATDWSVSEDGLKWTFKIRDGVKWHSGETLTAQDVVYTVQQIKLNAGSCYETNVRRITNAQAEGNTVVFTLNEPCSNFVNLMTFPIIKQQNGNVDQAYYIPCGTGAYIFSDKNEGNMYYLLRNENWWGGKGKLEEIRVKLLPDSETVMYSLSAGDIDIANTERGQQGRFVSNTDVVSDSCAMSVYDFIGINHKNAVLSNKEVRLAIDKAVNREKIVDDIFAGNASEAKSPIRSDWFINEDTEESFKADSEAAESRLLKAQWKKNNGIYQKKIGKTTQKLEFDLIVNEDNSSRMNIAESVKLDLESAGMVINVIPLSYEEYEQRIAGGKYELFIGSVMLSEELDYRFLLGEGNMFGYKNESMEQALNDTQTASGKDEIKERYGKFRKKFNSEIPIVGLCFENFDMLISKKFGGSLMSAQGNMYDGIFNLYIKEKANE